MDTFFRTNLPDPGPINADRGSGKLLYTGPLVVHDIRPSDVAQGSIADCFVPAAVASMAKLMPKALDDAMRKNDDGTFTFTFRRRTADGRAEKTAITVDGELYFDEEKAGIRYGRSGGKPSQTRMELWFPLLEKAYAQYVGSYEVLNQGGVAANVIAALTGRKARTLTVNPSRPDKLWSEVVSAVEDGRAASLGTYADGRHMRGSGIIDDHAYSLLDYGIDERGERWLSLRNPWGYTEPAGNGEDDGVFWLTLEKAAKYFESFDTVA